MKILEQTIYVKIPRRSTKSKKAKTTIPKAQWGVHATHCCTKHGCKYGYKDCPVELDLIKQRYACQDGDINDSCFEVESDLIEMKRIILTPKQLRAIIRKAAKGVTPDDLNKLLK